MPRIGCCRVPRPTRRVSLLRQSRPAKVWSLARWWSRGTLFYHWAKDPAVLKKWVSIGSPLQLFQPVEHDVQLCCWSLLLILLDHYEVLPVRSYVVRDTGDIQERPLKHHLRRFGAKFRLGLDGDRHPLQSITVKQSATVRRP